MQRLSITLYNSHAVHSVEVRVGVDGTAPPTCVASPGATLTRLIAVPAGVTHATLTIDGAGQCSVPLAAHAWTQHAQAGIATTVRPDGSAVVTYGPPLTVDVVVDAQAETRPQWDAWAVGVVPEELAAPGHTPPTAHAPPGTSATARMQGVMGLMFRWGREVAWVPLVAGSYMMCPPAYGMRAVVRRHPHGGHDHVSVSLAGVPGTHPVQVTTLTNV